MIKKYSAEEFEARAKEINDDIDELKSLSEEFLKSAEIVGSPNGFHNLSITYSKNDLNLIACEVLERGLILYPYNVDLLADYLQCGIDCGKMDKCVTYYEILKLIPKIKWTWRGYSFSIDYLIRKTDELTDIAKLETLKMEMLELADEYIEAFPDKEDAFLSKLEIFNCFNEKDQTILILEYVVENLKVCTKSLLRYADILFDRGEYHMAREKIRQCIASSATKQPTVSIAYIYYLLGLCEVAIYLSEGKEEKSMVEDIYKDFFVARENGISSSYNLVIDKHIRILEIKTGIKYDDITCDL